MPAPPDQFQRRTYVRLPFTDEYLERRDEKMWREELRRAFARPLLTVRILERGSLPRAGASEGRRGAPPMDGSEDEEGGGLTPP